MIRSSSIQGAPLSHCLQRQGQFLLSLISNTPTSQSKRFVRSPKPISPRNPDRKPNDAKEEVDHDQADGEFKDVGVPLGRKIIDSN